MEHTSTSLKGFGGWKLRPLGVVEMLVNIGMKLFEITIILDFMVVEEDILYQMIFGRSFMRISKCVMSNHYLALKYWVNGA